MIGLRKANQLEEDTMEYPKSILLWIPFIRECHQEVQTAFNLLSDADIWLDNW
ncbi:hypothetical protein SAMN05421813_10831 [Daejeonella rubra]|uniref:Uncharacterized protein n=1 Tax=Daejeonella rubra TaxID=990371 RepID=A0A1G9RI97_9SPHI|nr:hypothetical protein SAMN05421813_10831 [Daejeonella rubra]